MKVWIRLFAGLLLLTHGFGLAHNLVPHTTADHSENSGHAHHEDGENPDHFHITHLNHEDEGWVDYLVCLFSETEHPDAAEQQIPMSPMQFSLQLNGPVAEAIVTPGICLDLPQDPPQTNLQPQFVEISNPTPPGPVLSRSPWRGPPSIS